MFKANAIINAMKGLLESKLSPALKTSVVLDDGTSFADTAFEGGVSFVVISATTDAPLNPEEGFSKGHVRTLNLNFEIRTLGLPPQSVVEPIATAIADIVYEEHQKLSYGTSEIQNLVITFGPPTLIFDGLQSDKSYAAGGLDIPVQYFSTYPI